MLKDIEERIEIKKEEFYKNYNLTLGLQKEVDEFFENLNQLGESCDNPLDFEKRFTSEGYSNLLNGICRRCTPKSAVTSSKARESENGLEFSETMADDASESDENHIEKKESGFKHFLKKIFRKN